MSILTVVARQGVSSPSMKIRLSGSIRSLQSFGLAEKLTALVEFATMTLHPTTKAPLAKIYRPSEIDELLRKLELGGTQEEQVGVGEGTGGGGGNDGGNVSMST